MDVGTLRKQLSTTVLADVYRFFRYALPDFVLNRIVRTMRRGQVRKATLYPFRLLASKLKRRPRRVMIDLVSVCNLRCPMCSVPPDIAIGATQKKHLDLVEFKRIADELEGHVTDLSLVYSGEPLLHPSFKEIVEYAKTRFYLSTISNGTVIKGGRLEALVDGIDYLQFSFDGLSKESYEKYRVGANYDSVLANVNAVIDAKQRAGLGLPVVTITFLVNSYNEDEVESARSYWLENRGVNYFFDKPINLNVHRRSDDKKEHDLVHWLPRKSKMTLYKTDEASGAIEVEKKRAPCSIVQTPVIRGDGEILMCCHDLNNSVKIGNIENNNLVELWGSQKYATIRERGANRQYPICKVCGK
ncbi:MAG: radical SAM protein [Rhodocyclales bacterium]|nr:radical SAM protein [Rhodocyclales bacterium]